MFSVPINVIDEWPVPNYVNPDTRKNSDLWIITGIFVSLATGCVGTRLWARIFVRRWFGLDDLFIVLAFLCAIAVTGLVAIQQTRFHWNRHIWDLPIEDAQESTKLFYVLRIFWASAAICIRFSVLALYYRLLNAITAPRHYHWVLHGVTAFNIAVALVFLLGAGLSCIPVRAYWTFPPISGARCINDLVASESSGILNTFSEFIVALLPIIAVIQMKIDRPWTVIGLLSLGMCVVVVGCCRTFYIFKALNTLDFTWWSAPQWICAELENCISIICACAVPLRPVVGRMVEKPPRDSGIGLDSRRKSDDSVVVEELSEFNQAHVQADIEEVEEWTSIVQNVVDLEGIANDGRGYTVTITGPSRPRRAQRWFNAATTNLLDPTHKRNMPPPSTIRSLRIPLETEVKVEESFRSMSVGETTLHTGKSQRPSYDEKAMEEMYPDLFGDNNELTAAPPISVIFEDDQSVPPKQGPKS